MPHVSSNKLGYGAKAAIGVVLLAMLLAGLGLVLAIRHTRLTGDQRVNEVRAEAERLNRDLHHRITRPVTDGLRALAQAADDARAAGGLEGDPTGGDRRPSWLGDLFLYDGTELLF